MSVITVEAEAGTEGKDDVLVKVGPGDEGTGPRVDVQCKPLSRSSIERIVNDIVSSEGVTGGSITVVDKGALDFVLRARLRTALRRGGC